MRTIDWDKARVHLHGPPKRLLVGAKGLAGRRLRAGIYAVSSRETFLHAQAHIGDLVAEGAGHSVDPRLVQRMGRIEEAVVQGGYRLAFHICLRPGHRHVTGHAFFLDHRL
jgi:hypothetical protein